MTTISRSLALVAPLGFLLALTPPAGAQLCGGALAYIVRDAKGTPMDATSRSISFDRAQWTPRPPRAGDFATYSPKPPVALLTLLRKTGPLWSISYCTLPAVASLSLTMSGKTMELTFNRVPCCHAAHRYLVDGLPFEQGRFEITLAGPDSSWDGFYPASGWKKRPSSN